MYLRRCCLLILASTIISVACAEDYRLAANRARAQAEAAHRDAQNSIAQMQRELDEHPEDQELREMLVKMNQTTTVPYPSTDSWDWLTEDWTEASTQATTERWQELLDEQAIQYKEGTTSTRSSSTQGKTYSTWSQNGGYSTAVWDNNSSSDSGASLGGIIAIVIAAVTFKLICIGLCIWRCTIRYRYRQRMYCAPPTVITVSSHMATPPPYTRFI